MIRLLIVDESRERSKLLARQLSEQTDFKVMGCAHSPADAVARIETCDLMLVNSDLSSDGAYKLTRVTSRQETCVKVLILGPAEIKSTILRFLEVGARGYVRHDAPSEELARHIRAVYQGEALLPPEISAALINRLAEFASWFEEMSPPPGEAISLTRREREILHLIGRNFSNQDIANQLIIEVGTVKNHVHSILAKLKVSSRSEAATYLFLTKHQPRSNSLPTYSVSREQYLS